MNDKIHLKNSLLGYFIYFLMYLSYLIQKTLSEIFFLLFITPVLKLLQIISTYDKKPRKKTIHINMYLSKWYNKFLWNYYLKYMFFFNSKLHGIINNKSLYFKLIKWNPDIPIIGISKEKEALFFFTLLKDESNKFEDYSWLQKNKYQGTFQIVDKILNQNNIIIECVWTSGKNVGQYFKIEKGSNIDNILPDSIFFPPKIAIIFLEIITSASAILAFFALTKDGWTAIKNIITYILDILLTLFSK